MIWICESRRKYQQTFLPSPEELECKLEFEETGQRASTWTSGPTSRIAGARMKTPRNVSGPPSEDTSSGIESSDSKL